MKESKLTSEQNASLRKRIERLVWAMDDEQRAFFYDQPDALISVFGGELRGYFERIRRVVPPSEQASFLRQDAPGWAVLMKGTALMSSITRGVDVDYRPNRDDLFLKAEVFDDPEDVEDLEDLTERRRIIRAGGVVHRRLKRLWFENEANFVEIEGLVRLKGWKKVDARTLLAWSCLFRPEIEQHEPVMASDMPLLKRDGNTFHLVTSVIRQRDKNGEYIAFKRENVSGSPPRNAFKDPRSFLVEVPDDRDV